ncbi:hypothetical protein [Nonomuraea basaltis]|uniref:hypothetical protein n=1 Tax=Nonomuraea basaltis TaxID=2495887 RepID=UPI00110C4051|nr:hypothetical protein [Nonomuraea basaltis]TMR89078.1 hypothetical protein EJK15_62705 [Nonomuraea basaltis]
MHALIPLLYMAIVISGLAYLLHCAQRPYVLCYCRTPDPATCPTCQGTGIRLRLIWQLRTRTHRNR